MFSGPGSLPVAHLPYLRPPCSAAAHLASGVPPVWSGPGPRKGPSHRSKVSDQGSTGVEEDQAGLAEVELHDGPRGLDPLALNPRHRTLGSSSTRKLDRPGSPLTAPRVAGVLKGVSAPPEDAAGAFCGVLRDSRREVYPQTTVIRGSFPRPKGGHSFSKFRPKGGHSPLILRPKGGHIHIVKNI